MLKRRLTSIPLVLLATAIVVAASPLLAILAALVDAVSDRRFPRLRFLGVVLALLVMETLGLAAAAWLWLTRRRSGDGWLRAHYRLQAWWAGSLLAAATRLLGLRLTVEGPRPPAAAPPILLFARHASLIDSLLPAVLVGRDSGLRLRWVMKEELLWDPCLDVVGLRLPNLFVARGGRGASEPERIAALARGMGAGEGTVLFPEGTRFTPRKHAALLARAEESGDEARAGFLRRNPQVLPPRAGGSLALLTACPDADLYLMAHTGLEGASRLPSVVRGALIGAAVQVRFMRFEATERPQGSEALFDWLQTRWEEVGQWIARVHKSQP
jgi:1-acyl-sn-glycerol-3-phosphate acyltransferase